MTLAWLAVAVFYLVFMIWTSRRAGWVFGVGVTAFSAGCLALAMVMAS